jgi:arsenate reductase
MKILILCTGNSCRSQMAQGFLQSFDKSIEVHSAGTEPASKINRNAVKVMAPVDRYLNDEWDYVITVCDHANETCPVFIGEVKHRLHMGFEDPSKAEGSEEFIMSEFRRIREQIRKEFRIFYNQKIKPFTK